MPMPEIRRFIRLVATLLAITVVALFLSAAAIFVGVEFNQYLGERLRLRLRARRKLGALKRRRVEQLALAER